MMNRLQQANNDLENGGYLLVSIVRLSAVVVIPSDYRGTGGEM
jgi:hypothetical protein